MRPRRVFEIANEFGVDVRTVLDALRSLSEPALRPEAELSDALARKLRVYLNGGRVLPEEGRSVEPKRRQSKFAKGIRDQHDDAIRRVIPTMAARLRDCAQLPDGDTVIVAFHSRDAATRYGFCTVSGEPLPSTVLDVAVARALLAPLRDVDRDYVARGWTPPNLYIAFDLANQHVWLGRSLKTIGHPGERLAADSLLRVPPPYSWRTAPSQPAGAALHCRKGAGGRRGYRRCVGSSRGVISSTRGFFAPRRRQPCRRRGSRPAASPH